MRWDEKKRKEKKRRVCACRAPLHIHTRTHTHTHTHTHAHTHELLLLPPSAEERYAPRKRITDDTSCRASSTWISLQMRSASSSSESDASHTCTHTHTHKKKGGQTMHAFTSVDEVRVAQRQCACDCRSVNKLIKQHTFAHAQIKPLQQPALVCQGKMLRKPATKPLAQFQSIQQAQRTRAHPPTYHTHTYAHVHTLTHTHTHTNTHIHTHATPTH